MINNKNTYTEIASYLLMLGALLVILTHGLLVALFAGLLVHSLVLILSPNFDVRVGKGRARIVSVSLIGTFIITSLTLAVWGAITFFQSEAGSTHALLQKMADIVDASRAQCPVWICSHLPDNTDELRDLITNWMREHAQDAKSISTDASHPCAYFVGDDHWSNNFIAQPKPDTDWPPRSCLVESNQNAESRI